MEDRKLPIKAKCKHKKRRLLWVCHDCGEFEVPIDKELILFGKTGGAGAGITN